MRSRVGRILTHRMGGIDDVQDPTIFGCFPEFRPFLTQENIRRATIRLETMTAEEANSIVGMVPAKWELAGALRVAWAKLIAERARFVATSIGERLAPRMDSTSR